MAFDDLLKTWFGTSRGTWSYSEALSRHGLPPLQLLPNALVIGVPVLVDRRLDAGVARLLLDEVIDSSAASQRVAAVSEVGGVGDRSG